MPFDGGLLEGLGLAAAAEGSTAAAGTTAAVAGGSAAGVTAAGAAEGGAAAAGAVGAAGAGAAAAGGISWTTVLAGIGTAMSLIGSGVSAMGQVKQGEQQQQIQNTNAAIAEQQAATVTDQATAQAMQDRQSAQRKIGQIIATYGASGVDVGSGSALDVLADSATQGELTAQTDEYRGTVQSNAFLTQAALDRMTGSEAASAGSTRAIGTVVSGLSNAAKNAIPLFTDNTPKKPTPAGALQTTSYEF